jgi:prepilin peptidase dependent protein B
MLVTILPRQKGFSLVELMISLTLGLVVMGGALSIVTSILATNTSTLKMTRLDQELRTVMMMLTRDLRRAGSWRDAVDKVIEASSSSGASGPILNPFFDEFSVINDLNGDGEADDGCILFSYDSDSDGLLDDDERYGFRLDTEDKAVEIRKDGASCTEGGWENITDENSIEITALEIEPTPLSFSAGRVILRQYTVTLTGQLKNDPAVKRTLQKTVKVRNNKVSVN